MKEDVWIFNLIFHHFGYGFDPGMKWVHLPNYGVQCLKNRKKIGKISKNFWSIQIKGLDGFIAIPPAPNTQFTKSHNFGNYISVKFFPSAISRTFDLTGLFSDDSDRFGRLELHAASNRFKTHNVVCFWNYVTLSLIYETLLVIVIYDKARFNVKFDFLLNISWWPKNTQIFIHTFFVKQSENYKKEPMRIVLTLWFWPIHQNWVEPIDFVTELSRTYGVKRCCTSVSTLVA